MLPILALELKVIEAIKLVFDPEIPVDVYELGLIYAINIDDDNNVQVEMTLTAPSCFAAEQIPVDVESRIREIEEVKEVKVDVVFEPAWTQDMMTMEAKLTLGFL